MSTQSTAYVPGPAPQEYQAEHLERELRGASDMLQNLKNTIIRASFTLWWNVSTGIEPQRTRNVFSVVPQGAGIYRVTLKRLEVADRDLSVFTLPFTRVLVPSKTDEGTVTTIPAGSGTDGSGRDWYDIYLSETYIAGQNLRERAYTLVAGDALYGIGLMAPEAGE